MSCFITKNKKMGKNSCLVFLNGFGLVLQCDAFVVIVLSDEPRQN